tara:strand:- start:330 stop:965 length:636 start_codon:yes stop_codon:yes gene_type:complete
MTNFLILFITFLSISYSFNRGWTHPETGWQILSGTDMCLFVVENVFIDNNLPEFNNQDAIGIFYQNQCIGWAYYTPSITIIPTIGNDGDNPQFPSPGDEIHLFIYDKSSDQILNLQSLIEIPNWTLWGSSTIPNTYGCYLNLPIQMNGVCPDPCDGDLNNDMVVDIIDIISIIDIILFCEGCENNSCGDIDGNNEIDVQDILIIIDLIVGN